jgi:hypothetical protein
MDDSELTNLRALLDREQAFFTIEHQQARIFEKTLLDSVKSVIFATRKVYSLHLAILEHERTGRPVEVFDIATAPPLVFPSSSTSRPFQLEIGTLISNLNTFAAHVVDFLTQNPDSENSLLYSCLPGLFNCLWSQDESSFFVDFLLCFENPFLSKIGRLFLPHPSMYVFLCSLQTDIEKLIVSNLLTLSSLLSLFSDRQFLFPAALKTVLSRLSDPLPFFTDAILLPLLENPSLYGLLPATDTNTFESIIHDVTPSALDPFLRALIAHIPSGAPTPESFAGALAGSEQLVYLSRSDLLIIKSLTAVGVDIPDSEGVCAVPVKRRASRAASGKSPEAAADDDPFESLLRSLFLQLDVSHTHATIFETLDSALMLYTGRSRLALELSLDDFKRLKTQRGAPDDTEHYVALLNAAYERRMSARTNTLSNWSMSGAFKVQQLQSGQARQHLQRKRQMLFFAQWASSSGAFEAAAAKRAEICQSAAAFKAEYRALLAQFQQYSDGLKLGLTKEQFTPIVYGRLTQVVPLSVFRDADPDLARKDARIARMIEEKRADLYARNAQPFLQPFIENPKLMGLSAEHLRRAFAEETPIPIAWSIDRALSAMIHLLSFQGHREIGADHWLPITLMLFIYVNPPRIASVMQYMHNFLLTLSDGNPVSQSQEYNVTMAHSAAAYFSHELESWEPAGGGES